MSFGNLFQNFRNQKEKYAQDMFLKSWKELNECQRQQVIEAIHTIEKVKKEYPEITKIIEEYQKKDIHGDLVDLMRNYLDKFCNNMELLDKFSQFFYFKPFNETSGNEKIIILKYIEPFIKIIEEKHIYTKEELLKGKKFQDLHSQMAIKCGIDVNDLPSMTKRTDSQKYIIEEIVNQLKEFGTEEVIKHYLYLDKPLEYWENLKYITDFKTGSDKIQIDIRYILNRIAINNIIKKYAYRVKDKVEKEPGRRSASEPQFLAKEEHNDFHTFDKKENDVVNTPKHYIDGRKYQPINVIQDWKLDFALGNCIKYCSRLSRKDEPKQDINKALFYLIYKCKELGLTQEEIEKTVKQIFSM